MQPTCQFSFWPRWQAGRQGGGYRKLRLARGARWDAYLIAYPRAHGIPEHTDPLARRRHLRVNLALLGGGSRLHAAAPVFQLGPLAVFWSDRPHRVEPGPGRRLVLSIGLAL